MQTAFEVIPAFHIPRPHSGRFSYDYTGAMPLARGAVVEIPFGKRVVIGMVWGPALKRDARFSLKPILRVLCATPLFPENMLTFFLWESAATFTPLGDILHRAIPALSREGARYNHFAQESAPVRTSQKKEARYLFISGSEKKRIARYRKLITHTTRAGGQTLLLAPTLQREQRLREKLGDVAQTASRKTPRTAFPLFRELRCATPHAIIGTRNALFLPFSSLRLIILDDATNALHKQTHTHPFLDNRHACRALAYLYGATLAIGAELPPIDEFRALGSPSAQKKSAGTVTVIDLRKQRPDRTRISVPLKEALRRTTEKSGAKVLVFVNRRGAAPALVCADCGFVFNCPSCAAPIPIFRSLSENEKTKRGKELRCRHCGRVTTPPLTCPSCHGLRLFPKGIGSEGFEHALKRLLPRVWIERLDSDAAPTPQKQRTVLAAFRDQKTPAILIATVMALDKPLPSLDLAALPAFEQLLAIPDFRTEERAFLALSRIRTRLKPKGRFLIQTWRKEGKMLRDFVRGNYTAFARRELSLRKKLALPPFTRLAKLTFSHRDAKTAEKESKRLAEVLAAQQTTPAFHIIGPTPAFIHRVKNHYRWHIVVSWQPKNVLDVRTETLLWKLIPPFWEAETDPDTIL